MEYCAVAWYPGLSHSNVERLEVVQKPLGLPLVSRAPPSSPLCTWSPSPGRHRCRKIPPFSGTSSPLQLRPRCFKVPRICAPKLQAGKPSRTPSSGNVGFEPPGRGTLPLLPLHNREPVSFITAFPPSQAPSLENVHYYCSIPGTTSTSSDDERLEALATLGPHDSEF